MRTRLFLSAAVATLSLSLSQGYAQHAGREPVGGDAAKQGESTRMQKPSERRDERAQRERGARDAAEKSDRQGAAAKEEEKRAAATGETKHEATKGEGRNEAAKAEDKHGAKKGQKHGAAKKDEQRGAMGENRDRTPTAQGAGTTDRQDRMGERAGQSAGERAGASPSDRTGAATTDAERRGAQAEGEKAGWAGERTGAATTDAERPANRAEGESAGRGDQAERRGDMESAQQRGPETFDRSTGETARGARGRDTYGYAGREGRGAGRYLLSQQDHVRVRQMLEQRGASVSRDSFNLRAGAVVPPNVQFYPLPADVLAIAPQFQGYDYVKMGDDIAIINPGSHEVVTVLDEGGPAAAYGYGYDEQNGGFRDGDDRGEGRYGRSDEENIGSAQRDQDSRERHGEAYGYAPRVRLDNRQERALYRGVINEARSNLRQVCVRVGERVPESVDIEPVPRSIAAEAPDAERFEYFVLNDQVVLVDPDTRIVVDIIEQPR